MKDKAAFEKLFEEAYKDNLYKVRYYAYNYLKDYDMADNVAQETFYRLWENRTSINFNLCCPQCGKNVLDDVKRGLRHYHMIGISVQSVEIFFI